MYTKPSPLFYLITSIFWLSLSISVAHAELVTNGDFKDGRASWRIANKTPQFIAKTVSTSQEGTSAYLEVPSGSKIGYPQLTQNIEIEPGKAYLASAKIKAGPYDKGAGPYIAVEYFDANNKRIAYTGLPFPHPIGEWQTVQMAFYPPDDTASGRINLIMHGIGDGWFTDVSVTELPSATSSQAEDKSTISLEVADLPNEQSLALIGAEDDGWAYHPGNLKHGWTEKELTNREERIKWMNPHQIRMFFWVYEWMPRDFMTNEAYKDPSYPIPYKWDSPEMKSKLRTLQFYKDQGININAINVVWLTHNFWQEDELVIRAFTDLMSYLIKEKGFDNINLFTLCNEPNLSFGAEGGSFDDYVDIQLRTMKSLKAAGLNLKLVTSDDGNNSAWFDRVVQNDALYAEASYFASHRYIQFPEANRSHFDRFFTNRMNSFAARTDKKPFIVTEFGFQHKDVGNHVDNPFTYDYDYALNAADFMIEGFQHGTAGYSIWTLHEMYYAPHDREQTKRSFNRVPFHADNLMTYGMWSYHGDEEKPIYHWVANMMRETTPGEAIYPVKTSSTDIKFNSIKIGDTLFWVNMEHGAVEFSVDSFRLKDGFVFTQMDVDPSENGLEQVSRQTFTNTTSYTAPPRSFGFAELENSKNN
ncbi:carbohydrate binding domain-containing protein [Coraliomargarita sp. W4R72]